MTWSSDGSAELEVIPEDDDRGADTLTPGDTCHNYVVDDQHGHDNGYTKLAEWQKVFTKPIAQRLAHDVSGVHFGPLDIYSMMEMCGFEILARGVSPWCDVFTHQEWLEFEYARDLLHFYRAGPGNMYAAAMGFLWLNATKDLMTNESSNDVYFSFVHDGDIVPVLAALGIFDEASSPTNLPSDHMKSDRHWRTSDVVPMGGRLIFERIGCGTGQGGAGKEHAIRLFINDGLVDLTKLSLKSSKTDIEGAIPLDGFRSFLSQKEHEVGDFREICGLPEDAAGRITFLHQ